MLTDKLEYFSKQRKTVLLVLKFILVIAVGWVDYITGPVYSLLLLHLMPVLTTALIFFLLVTYIIASLKSAFEREKLAAGTDALTGVANRRHFYELADAEISRLKRYGLLSPSATLI